MGTATLAGWRIALAILWRTLLFFLAFALMGALLIVPLAPLLSQWEADSRIAAQLYPDIAGAVAMLAATWLMLRFIDRRPFRTIGLEPKHAIRDIAVGMATGASWLALSLGIAWVAGWVTLQIPVVVSLPLLAGAAIAVFFNVLTQQFLLCGVIFQTIQSKTNFAAALLISAALFSAYHGGAFQGQWLPAINVFAAGALFCLAYGLSGNLWLPIGIHFAWNFLLGPVLGLTVSGTSQLGIGWTAFSVEGPSLFTGGAFGLEGGLIVTVTVTAFCMAFVLLRSQRQVAHNKAVL